MSQVFYLYCLISAGKFPPLEGPGIDGDHPLFLETMEDIAAVLCEVSLEMFSGPVAEERLQDLSWIAPRACRHEEVVMAVGSHVPVLPVRFGTVFSSPAHLAAVLEKHRQRVTAFLQHVEGSAEWTVKGFMDRGKAREEIARVKLEEQAGALAELPPGKRYFVEQRLKAAVDMDLRLWLRELTDDVVKSLSPLTSDFSQRRLLARDVTGDDDEMFFNGAFLVPATSLAGLQYLVAKFNDGLAARGLRFDLSGPWPPYSFAPALDEALP